MGSFYSRRKDIPSLPSTFVGRRLQSLAGLFLVLFLLEHLFTNSQAALFVGDDGSSFINSVNFLYSLPYRPIIEITLIGFPIVIHGWLGIKYLLTSKPNSFNGDGSKPELSYLPRNQGYTWQRITALILVFGIFLHVVHMRFINYPVEVKHGIHKEFCVKISEDPGLASVCKRLNVTLVEDTKSEIFAVTKNFGTSVLLTVRDAFKSIWLCIFYTIFVIATCFHAFNGVWTFSISWGIALSERGRVHVRKFSNMLLFIIAFLGLAAIWGTYWVNLRN